MNDIELILQNTNKIPSFSSDKLDYDSFFDKFEKEVSESLENLFCKNEYKLIEIDLEEDKKEQNGIMFSFNNISKRRKGREDIFYMGTIWSNSTKKKEFYSKFNLAKNYYNTTLVDFLLYSKKLLIPSMLTIRSIPKEEYTSNISTFGKLVLPLINIKEAENAINKAYEQSIEMKSDKLDVFLEDNKGYKKNILEQFKIIKENFTQDLLELVHENMRSAALDITEIDKEEIKNAIIMHNFSIYAQNLIIFSSGTYNNVSGLIFSCAYEQDNWCNIKQKEHELMYLDGKLRQISTFQIQHEERVKKDNFRDDYEKRKKLYIVLSNIVVAILSSIKETSKFKIDKIESRVKDFDSLFDKINRYKKYYDTGEFDKLYYQEIDNEINDLFLEIEKFKDDDAKVRFGNIPENVITDLCGSRIIFNYKEEAEKFSLLENIAQYFVIHEKQDKHKINEKEYGYASIHFILSLKDDAINVFLGDKQHRNTLSTMIFELQVRTILQHGWATASHNIQYKSNGGILDDDDLRKLNLQSGKLSEVDEKIDEIRNNSLTE